MYGYIFELFFKYDVRVGIRYDFFNSFNSIIISGWDILECD